MSYQKNSLENFQVFCVSKNREDSIFQSKYEVVQDTEAMHNPLNVSNLLLSNHSSSNNIKIDQVVLDEPENFCATSKNKIESMEGDYMTVDIDYNMITNNPKVHIDNQSIVGHDISQIVSTDTNTSLQRRCLLKWNVAASEFIFIPLNEKANPTISAFVDVEKPSCKIHQCNVCEDGFDEIRSLLSHYQDAHHLYKCPYCVKYFTKNSSLKAHSFVHTDRCEFACPHCEKKFKRRKDLRQHIKRFNYGDIHIPAMFLCDTCGYQAWSKRTIRSHVLSHMNAAPYRCDVCDKQCKSNLDLADHRNTHFDIKPYQCDVCKMSFTRKHTMVKHRRTQHECLYSYICDICGRNFVYKTSLRVHMQLHKGENRVECDICGKSMSGKIALLNHKKIHTQQRDFVCGICGKMYINKYSLQEHLLVHTGSKPFLCLLCDNSFSSRKKLLMHERIHDPLRTHYKCSFCEKSYLAKFKLKDHVRKHHPTIEDGFIS